MYGTDNPYLKKIISSYLLLSSRVRYVISLLVLAVYIAYALRLTAFIEQGYIHRLIVTMFVFSTCITTVLLFGGVYKVVCTRASIEEYSDFLKWYVVFV